MPGPSLKQHILVAEAIAGRRLKLPPKIKRPPSVFLGKTWTAYRLGQDTKFPQNWVSRDEYGNLCACVNSRKALITNARLCEVKLRWVKNTLK